jgi:hypothetical protein
VPKVPKLPKRLSNEAPGANFGEVPKVLAEVPKVLLALLELGDFRMI